MLQVNSGDLLYLSVSGSTLTVKLNGTVLATRTDTSITAPGFAGLDVTDYDGQGTPGAGQCDDWEGGTMNTVTTPANVAGIPVSSSAIDLSWDAASADGGIAGYTVLRNGSQIASTVNTFYNDTGLTLGTTYSYSVAAFDVDGNPSAPSTPIAVTTLGDTTPPSAPTALAGTAASSTQINLTWTASTDNVGIARYKVFRGSTQVGTSTNASYADTGLTASTSYTYSVSAVDPAGNESPLSLPTTVTTNDAPVVGGAIVAFSFDEASGTTANDSSANHNNGALLNGATWGTGHSGAAAQFDGINDYVSAGNVAALNGLTAVTVSAWVKGAVGAASPDGVIIAKDAAFALVVDGHKVLFGVKSGNNWSGFRSSTTSVDDGQYHFVTGVYDGTTVKVYVDGVLESSQNVPSRTLNAPTTNLQIASCVGGPNCDSSGEMWQGLIDDVRVYDRALTATEIVIDMQNSVR